MKSIKEIINEEKLYFIDKETGGLKSYINGLCSCCIKSAKGDTTKNFLFYPQKAVYDYEAFKVNHLNINHLYSKGASREDLIDFIKSLVNKQEKDKYLILCGWNVGFDIDFLLQVYKNKKVSLPCPIISFDLKKIAEENVKKKDKTKKEDSGVDNYKLVTIYQYFFDDFSEEKAHTAEYDTLMVEKLYFLFKTKGWF